MRRPTYLIGRNGPLHSQDAQAGFTLVEIAIVLVIIGLLLGGVLRGQELVFSAHVRQLISQQEGIKAAFFGFQDRFRSFPGDFAAADRALRCPNGVPCLNGNGNGIVEENATPIVVHGVLSEVSEHLLVWMHLSSAGFLNGAYTMFAGDTAFTEINSPRSAYNNYLLLSYNANYSALASAIARHNLKTGPQVPVGTVAEVDRKIDDGNGVSGAFRYSTYAGTAPSAPPTPLPTYAPGQCMTNAGRWHVAENESNCGAASLL